MAACKTSDVVHHYYNPYMSPVFLDDADKSVGITEVKTIQNDGWFICQFRRLKKNSKVENYFDLNKQHFVLAAYGDFNQVTDKLGGARAHLFKKNSSRPFSFSHRSCQIHGNQSGIIDVSSNFNYFNQNYKVF